MTQDLSEQTAKEAIAPEDGPAPSKSVDRSVVLKAIISKIYILVSAPIFVISTILLLSAGYSLVLEDYRRLSEQCDDSRVDHISNIVESNFQTLRVDLTQISIDISKVRLSEIENDAASKLLDQYKNIEDRLSKQNEEILSNYSKIKLSGKDMDRICDKVDSGAKFPFNISLLLTVCIGIYGFWAGTQNRERS